MKLIASTIFCVLFSCLLALPAFGQEAKGLSKIKPLQIGDTIPESLWHTPLQVVNHPDGRDTVTLNDYRDRKLIILDFWTTWCKACFTSFPKYQDIVAKKTEVTILPISYQNDFVIMKARAKNDVIASFKSTIVHSDSTLKKYFPFQAYPHLVWVDSIGRVCGTTAGDFVNNTNIDAFLSSNPVEWSKKIEFDNYKNQPIIDVTEFQPIYYTVFKEKIDGYPFYHSTLVIDTLSRTVSIRLVNQSPLDLLLKGLRLFNSQFPNSHIRTSGIDLSDLTYVAGASGREAWLQHNAVSYESKFPLVSNSSSIAEEWRYQLLDDLQRYYRISAQVDSTTIDVFVIKGDVDESRVLNTDDFNMISDVDLLKEWNNSHSIPLLNEVNDRFKVNLTLSNLSVEKLQKELSSIGLKLSSESRKLALLNISRTFNSTSL